MNQGEGGIVGWLMGGKNDTQKTSLAQSGLVWGEGRNWKGKIVGEGKRHGLIWKSVCVGCLLLGGWCGAGLAHENGWPLAGGSRDRVYSLGIGLDKDNSQSGLVA